MTTSSRTFLALILLCTLFSSCLTAKKLDQQVAKQYIDKDNLLQAAKTTEQISVTSPLIDQSEQISTSTTSTSHMLPLVLYWSWEYRNSCKLNPRIPVNFLATQLNKSGALKQKLVGRKLDLVVEQVPANFAIVDKAHVIFFGYAFGWDKVTIKGDEMNLSVSYKLSQSDSLLKTGQIILPPIDNKRTIGMYASWKTAMSDFLDQYDTNLSTMSKALVANLLKEL
jgi:hypothetical protein